MAFTEDSVGGSFNSTNNVTIVIGDANGTKLVKNVVINNLDNASHTVIIEFVKSSVAYRMFSVYLAPGDTLVQDFILALVNANYTLRARLGEGATTQPQFVATLAQVS
jgi:hypothetical protein